MFRVLVFGFHDTPPRYIGGGWIRTMEILRRSKKHRLDYFMIENKPALRDVYGIDYEGVEIDVNGIPQNRVPRDLAMIKAIRRGSELARNEDFDLILSPNEQHMCVLPACLTSALTGVPWTAVLQLAPVYWSLTPDTSEHRTSSFRDMFSWFKHFCQCSTSHATMASFVSSLVFRAARMTPMLALGEGIAEDMKIIDRRVETIVLNPSCAVDMERIPTLNTAKEFDGLCAAPQKGFYDLLKIWRHVVDRRPEATLAIVGTAPSSMVDLITRTAHKFGLAKNVYVKCDIPFGSQEQIWSFMKRSRIYLYPSRVDSWGLTVAEAVACGVPVVAYDIAAIRFAHGKCPAVHLIKVGEVNDFALKCLQLLNDQELIRRVSSMAAAYAKENYQWDKVVEAEKAAYMRVIDAHRLRRSKSPR